MKTETEKEIRNEWWPVKSIKVKQNVDRNRAARLIDTVNLF